MPPDQSSCTQATEDPDRGPLGSRPSNLQVCGRLWERQSIRRNLAFPSSSPSWVGSLRGRGEGQLGAQPPGGGPLKSKKNGPPKPQGLFFFRGLPLLEAGLPRQLGWHPSGGWAAKTRAYRLSLYGQRATRADRDSDPFCPILERSISYETSKTPVFQDTVKTRAPPVTFLYYMHISAVKQLHVCIHTCTQRQPPIMA